jgi:hypothetical protein
MDRAVVRGLGTARTEGQPADRRSGAAFALAGLAQCSSRCVARGGADSEVSRGAKQPREGARGRKR